MSYENAPSTRLLATHCCVCRRPLRDAVSVELGIGPICRRKHVFDVPVDEAERRAANEIVHAVACAQAITADQVNKLTKLGFAQLAGILFRRIGEQVERIKIGITTSTWRGRHYVKFTIEAPYWAAANPLWRQMQGRWWNRDKKRNEVAAVHSNISRIVDLIRQCYPNALCIVQDTDHPHRELLMKLASAIRAVSAPAFTEQPCTECDGGFRGNKEGGACDGEGYQ